MTDTFVLLELSGYVGLLLWGTHMVTSGVQRGFGAQLRRWLGRNLKSRGRAFGVGVGMTALLQSSTAAGLMATSFVAAGFIGLGPGLAVMLGANVGTTLITQVLSFNIAPASRETLRAADLVEGMLRGALQALRDGDRKRASEINQVGHALDGLGAAIRRYLADLGNQQPLDDELEGARVQEILSAVLNLEHAGNIVTSSLMEVAVKKIQRSHLFSAEEIDAIAAIHGEVLDSLRLAVSIFLSGDAKEAARLVARKAALRDMEAQATALHVRLLRDAATGARGGEGDRVGLIAEGSSLFLHVVCDLRRVHSHIAAFAYPAISRQGRPAEIAR